MRALAILIFSSLAGCASPDAAPPVQPVNVKAETFCEIMRGVIPENNGKPRWDVTDNPVTIRDARRLGIAVDRNCSGPSS